MLNSSTDGPNATTVPIYSCPGVKFLLNGNPPSIKAGGPRLITSRSVAQIATASIFTNTSDLFGISTILSTKDNSPGLPKTQAFIFSGIGNFLDVFPLNFIDMTKPS